MNGAIVSATAAPEGASSRVGTGEQGMRRQRGAMAEWFSLVDSGTRLAFEVPQVMAMRMAALAMGGPAAGAEAARMVAEKAEAAGRAGAMAAAAMGSGRADGGAAAIARMYARKVSANRRRLSGG